MDVEALAGALLPWLGTWLLHSTALLGLVWLLVRIGPRIAPATEVTLWRGALFGSVLTAVIAMSLGTPAPATRIELDLPHSSTAAAPIVANAPAPVRPLPAPVDASPLRGVEAPAFTPDVVEAAATAPTPFPWAPVLAIGWAVGALLLTLRRGVGSLRFRRRVADRRPLHDGRLITALSTLSKRSGLRTAPRLTVSQRLPSPVALGLARGEICLPQRAVTELAPAQQEALLAHELGHIKRRDAVWLLLERIVTGVLFLQPLHLVARRRIRDATELACDAFAVEATAHPMALAECLAEVAGWVTGRRRPAVVPAMAHTPSLLARRVDLLLESTPRSPRGQRGARLAALMLITAVAVFVPGVQRTPEAVADEPPAEPKLARFDWSDRAAPYEATLPLEEAGPREVDGAVERELAAIDAELKLLAEALAELRGMLPHLSHHAELQKAATRLVNRSTTLFERRAALSRALEGED